MCAVPGFAACRPYALLGCDVRNGPKYLLLLQTRSHQRQHVCDRLDQFPMYQSNQQNTAQSVQLRNSAEGVPI